MLFRHHEPVSVFARPFRLPPERIALARATGELSLARQQRRWQAVGVAS